MNSYKKLLACLLIFNLLFLASLNGAQSSPPITCDFQLQQSLQSILKIPEAKALVEEIAKEGPIRIMAGNHAISQQFGAFWDPDRRIICIHSPSNISQHEVIKSLLFELHNASSNSKIHHINQLARQGKIDKACYIKSMEYLEYINSKKAAKMALEGIKMGAIPRGCVLPTYPTFQEHYAAQQQSGHSACFARNYDRCL